MPWYELIQPWRPTISETEPETWQVRMQEPDEEGWPSNEAFVPVFEEAFYFDCNPAFVEGLCEGYIWEDSGGLEPEPGAFDQCYTDNIGRCAQILTDDLPYYNGWLQVRACDAEGVACSSWSNALVVPEPLLTIALGVGTILLAIMCRLRGGQGGLAQRGKQSRRPHPTAPQAH